MWNSVSLNCKQLETLNSLKKQIQAWKPESNTLPTFQNLDSNSWLLNAFVSISILEIMFVSISVWFFYCFIVIFIIIIYLFLINVLTVCVVFIV